MTPCSLVDKCQILGGFKSVKPPRSPWPARESLLLLILSNVKVSTKFYVVNNIVPVILFACRTQLDLSELCLRFSPPNQEKDATLFLRTCCFFLQMARISCPETSVPNTNLRHVTSEKSESLKPAPLALPRSTFGKSQAVFKRKTEWSYQ
jgi:hypothetical protein